MASSSRRGRRGRGFLAALLGTGLALADWLVLVSAIVTGLASIPAIENSWGELTPILQLPAAVMVIPLAACMVLLALYGLARILGHEKRMALRVGVPLILVLAAVLATRAAWLPFVQGDAGMYGSLVILLAVVLVEHFFYGVKQSGWASTIAAISLFSGTQLLILGVIGEYVGRAYMTLSGKPQSLVREVISHEVHTPLIAKM